MNWFRTKSDTNYVFVGTLRQIEFSAVLSNGGIALDWNQELVGLASYLSSYLFYCK